MDNAYSLWVERLPPNRVARLNSELSSLGLALEAANGAWTPMKVTGEVWCASYSEVTLIRDLAADILGLKDFFRVQDAFRVQPSGSVPNPLT